MTEELDAPSAPSSAPPSRERIVLLGNASMRARRRPRTVLLLFVFEVVLGLVLTAPVAAHVRAVYGSHPDGDAPLFAPGGLDLAMFVADAQRAFPLMSSHVALLSLLGAVASLVPLSIFLLSVAHTTADLRAPRVRQMWPRVAGAFVPLLALLAMATIAEVVTAALSLLAVGKLSSSLAPSWGDARADQVALFAGVVLFAGVAAVGVVHDLSRAAVVRFRHGALGAVKLGAKTFARAPARLLWSWAWRAGAALVPVAAVSAIATRIGGRGGGALFALFLLHQAVILARVTFRASWLARAMRAVDGALGAGR